MVVQHEKGRVLVGETERLFQGYWGICIRSPADDICELRLNSQLILLEVHILGLLFLFVWVWFVCLLFSFQTINGRF